MLAINTLMIQPYIKHRRLVKLHLALPQRNVMWTNYNAGQTNQFNHVLNPSKLTKYMFLSFSKLSSYHELDNNDIDLKVGSTSLERVSSAKLCGIHIDLHLKWEENLKQVSASCYRTLAILKKLRNFSHFIFASSKWRP